MPSPFRNDWMPPCVGKRQTDRQINRPEPRDSQVHLPPHQPHARSFPAEQSLAARRRTSTSAAQTRSRAHRAGLALRGKGNRRRGVSSMGKPECSECANGRKSSLITRRSPPTYSAEALKSCLPVDTVFSISIDRCLLQVEDCSAASTERTSHQSARALIGLVEVTSSGTAALKWVR